MLTFALVFSVLTGCASGNSSGYNPDPTQTPSVTTDQGTPTDAPAPDATDTPAPPPTDTPAPTATPSPAIAYGVYDVTIQGAVNSNPVDLNATLVVFPGQESHPIDVCLYTGGSLAEWAATTGVGAMGFASNSACSQNGSIAGAAGVDYALVSADLNAGTVTVTADPTKCCSYNLSTNGFTVSSGLLATPYGIAQGTLTLHFTNGSQDVSGTLGIGGCTLNPYCVAIPYDAIISGQYSSSL